MKRNLLLVMLLALAAVVLGSRGEGATANPTFLYVHDDGFPSRVFAFQFGNDGKLTELAGSPVTVGDSGEGNFGPANTIAYSVPRKLLFVGESDGIAVLTVGSDGSLTPVAGSPFGGVPISGVGVVEFGSSTFVYGVDPDANEVFGFQVQSNGSLTGTPGSPYPAGVFPTVLSAVKNLVIAGSNDGTLSSYRAQADGSLVQAPGSPFSVGSGREVQGVTITPDGRFVYVPGRNDSAIFEFKVASSGALTPLPKNPFHSSIEGVSALAAPKKALLMTVGISEGEDGKDIEGIRRIGKTGRLKHGPTSASGIFEPEDVAVSPSQKFMVITSGDDEEMRSYSLTGNGTATQVDQLILGGGFVLNGIVFAQP